MALRKWVWLSRIIWAVAKIDNAAPEIIRALGAYGHVLTLAIHFKRDADTNLAYFDPTIVRDDEDRDEDPAAPLA